MLQIVASAIVLGGLALVPFCVARRGARQRLPPPAAAEFSSAADDQCVSWQSSSLSSLSNLERHRTPTLPAQACAAPRSSDPHPVLIFVPYSCSIFSLHVLSLRGPLALSCRDECKIAVRAIGLNYADVFCCLGLYEAANKMLAEKGGALCPGLEFAGEVMEVGPEVRNLRKGDRVYGFSRFVRHLAALKLARRAPPSVRRAASMFIVDGGSTDSCSQGAYRTKIIAREPLLRKVPADWTYAEAASLLVQGLTAWHGLVELGGARKGSRVLVHSAAGGVGCAALTICDAIGADAVAVVGAAEKVEFLRARYPRCTPLVRARESQYAAQLAELGGEFDVVLESLGGRYLSAALEYAKCTAMHSPFPLGKVLCPPALQKPRPAREWRSARLAPVCSSAHGAVAWLRWGGWCTLAPRMPMVAAASMACESGSSWCPTT